MAPVPWELEEDILSRLRPRSLVRFRSVCKRWNDLLDEKWFINSHFTRSRPELIFVTNSKIYSIEFIGLDGVDPRIEFHELGSSGIPHQEIKLTCTNINTFDGLLFLNYFKKTAVWNPWLRQVKWLEYEDNMFDVHGLGYDNTKPEKVYKIFGGFICLRKNQQVYHQRVAIYECASHAFKFIDTPDEDWPIDNAKRFHVSFKGNLYWISWNPNTAENYIRSFDFSRDIFKPFSVLPCRKNKAKDGLILSVFKGDCFSVLKLCYATRTIEIWVTKNKIDDGHQVVWINLMTLQPSYMPNIVSKCFGLSYFIYDNTTLIMACAEEDNGAPCIYIIKRDMFKKIQIGSEWLQYVHCVYVPNFIPLP
ncbi:putative F-box/LRR-repeat protein [Cardamine amara subsp. amara]|uniref:F-box/LRR-repeat protein n=1 Tax=Cardamine amara subsp. amara TaxID=228776 RepID=A0ABD1A1Y4_CARAN